MRSSSGWSGRAPAASMAASSMQLAQKSPIFVSSLPAADEDLAAFSSTVRSLFRFSSKSRENDPQYDGSAGRGLAFNQPPFPKPLRLVHAETERSRSAGSSPWLGLAGVAPAV